MAKTESGKENHIDQQDIFSIFINEFIFKIAINDKDKKKVYRLRHEVYCQEIGYQPPLENETNIESPSPRLWQAIAA